MRTHCTKIHVPLSSLVNLSCLSLQRFTMPQELFPAICTTLRGLTHLRLHFAGADIAPHFGHVQHLVKLRSLQLWGKMMGGKNDLLVCSAACLRVCGMCVYALHVSGVFIWCVSYMCVHIHHTHTYCIVMRLRTQHTY